MYGCYHYGAINYLQAAEELKKRTIKIESSSSGTATVKGDITSGNVRSKNIDTAIKSAIASASSTEVNAAVSSSNTIWTSKSMEELKVILDIE